MAQPASILNTRAQSTDTLYGADGVAKTKLGVGTKDVGLTPDAAWQGAATHEDGSTFEPSDGVVVVAGLDSVDGETVRPALVDADGRLEVTLSPTGGALTDVSGTITVGGTAQELAAAKPNRKYFFVQNLDDAEALWIDFTVDAVEDTPSIRLDPGASFIMESAFVTSEKITTIATTTSHKFTAKEA